MIGFLRRWWQRIQADVRLLRQARRDAHEKAWGFVSPAAWDGCAADEPIGYWPTEVPPDVAREARRDAVRNASDRFITYAIRQLERQFDASEEAGP